MLLIIILIVTIIFSLLAFSKHAEKVIIFLILGSILGLVFGFTARLVGDEYIPIGVIFGFTLVCVIHMRNRMINRLLVASIVSSIVIGLSYVAGLWIFDENYASLFAIIGALISSFFIVEYVQSTSR